MIQMIWLMVLTLASGSVFGAPAVPDDFPLFKLPEGTRIYSAHEISVINRETKGPGFERFMVASETALDSTAYSYVQRWGKNDNSEEPLAIEEGSEWVLTLPARVERDGVIFPVEILSLPLSDPYTLRFEVYGGEKAPGEITVGQFREIFDWAFWVAVPKRWEKFQWTCAHELTPEMDSRAHELCHRLIKSNQWWLYTVSVESKFNKLIRKNEK